MTKMHPGAQRTLEAYTAYCIRTDAKQEENTRQLMAESKQLRVDIAKELSACVFHGRSKTAGRGNSQSS
jgi:hypothetical protein